jgi:tetratricopeptide (TPR) repeat protein
VIPSALNSDRLDHREAQMSVLDSVGSSAVRPSIDRWKFILIAGAFGCLACCRLNSLCLLEPDSSDYVLMAESLARTGSYLAPYDPTGLPFAWRPPGLSTLLVAVALFWPNNVIACKVMIIGFALAALWLLHRAVDKADGFKASLVVAAIFASNPVTLLWSTEVVSEPVFVAEVIVVLLLLGGTFQVRPGSALLATVLMATLPFVRTVGLSLVLASMIWSGVSSRRRWMCPVFCLAAVPYAIWSVYYASGDHYFGFFRERFEQGDWRSLVGEVAIGTLLNLVNLMRVVMPGGAPGYAIFSYVTRFPAAWPSGTHSIATLLGCIILVLSALGMWLRRGTGGGLTLAFIVLYSGCLAIWPSKHDRLLWPLLAPLLLFLTVGFRHARERLALRSVRIASAFEFSAKMIVISVIAWQSIVSIGMSLTNVGWLLDERRGEYNYYPGYFADWLGAGTWLRENTLPFERVLVSRTEVFCTSQRFQKSMLLGIQALEENISLLPARYLTWPVGVAGSQMLPIVRFGNHKYQISVRYNGNGVAVCEICPNRTGTLARPRIVWNEAIDAVASQIRREPWRVDLLISLGSLLEMADRPAEALDAYRQLFATGRADCVTLVTMGSLAMDLGRFEDAHRYATAAASQVEADVYASDIKALLAVSLVRDESELTLPMRISRAWVDVQRYHLESAKSRFDELVRLHPNSGLSWFARGEFHKRCGMVHEATADFRRALTLNYPRAESKLEVLSWGDAMAKDGPSSIQVAGGREVRIDPSTPESHRIFAELLVRDGVPGRALDVLERAVDRFGDLTALSIPLAVLYCDFGLPAKAKRLYEVALSREPRNADAKSGLERCRRLMTVPHHVGEKNAIGTRISRR